MEASSALLCLSVSDNISHGGLISTSMFVFVSVTALVALIAIIVLIAIIIYMKIKTKRDTKRNVPQLPQRKTITVEYKNGRANSFENPVYLNQVRNTSVSPEPRYTEAPVEQRERDRKYENEYIFEQVSPTVGAGNCYAEIENVERINTGIGGKCTRIWVRRLC